MYTIGLKRRWLPGYRRYSVTKHDWQNFRFILNLADGSQEHIPGFSVSALKVYPDFWAHLAQLERPRVDAPVRAGATREPAPVSVPVPEQDPPQEPEQTPPYREPPTALELEVHRRAAERVRDIQARINEH